jgi:glycosyltransferase involved in cell wall biosynthesis
VSRARFDVVFYAPWAASLVGGRSAGGSGGAETQVVALAKALSARGLDVGLIVIGTRAELPGAVDGVRLVAQRPRPPSGGARGRASLALGAGQAMAGVKTQVLVQRSAGPTTGVAALMARTGRARFVYSSSSHMDFEFERHEPRRLNVRLYRWGIRHASAVVVQNAMQAGLCREAFGIEPVVISSILPHSERRSEQPDAFLWVGRLQDVKRPLAYLELARAVPEARFWMIEVPQQHEPPELRAAVDAAVRELPNLELLEPRPHAELGRLLDRTVAVVNTSIREGMPNVFLEGWARGVPALALSYDPDGVIAQRGLGAFAGGDGERLAEQARELWLARADQSALADRCIAYARAEHDPGKVVDRWIGAMGLVPER